MAMERAVESYSQAIDGPLIPVPWRGDIATVLKDVNGCSLSAFEAEQTASLPDTARVMTYESVQRAKAVEHCVHPHIDLLVTVSQQPLAVLAVFLEAGHGLDVGFDVIDDHVVF